MKKKIIIVSILIILVVVLLLIPKDVYGKIFKKNKNNEPKIEENLVYQTMYVKSMNKYLVGVKVGVKALEEDVVSQKWDILTKDVSLIPSGYSSPIALSTTLLSHEVKDGVLTLNVSEDFLSSEGRLAIECLAWNFCNDEVKEIVVKINDEKINEVNNYYFQKISKAMGVNLTYDTIDIFQANYVTITHYEDDVIKPVTYFYQSNLNQYEYVIKKVLNKDESLKELVMAKKYKYELKDKGLVISFDYSEQISDNIINTFKETFKDYDDLVSLTINGTDTVLLELDFKEVSE